jgi:hypothetical protein
MLGQMSKSAFIASVSLGFDATEARAMEEQ